jgi:Lrp/AsnC family leucine-responsive transcriptional regulator
MMEHTCLQIKWCFKTRSCLREEPVTRRLKGIQQMRPELDEIDCKLLKELQRNARTSFAELGRIIGLSTPAVIERVKRLEESQVILGYHAHVAPTTVGRSVEAFIKVSVAGNHLLRFAATVQKIDEVLECYRITGAESFLVLVAVRDTVHLQAVIDLMMPYVSTNTSIILDVPVRWNAVEPELYSTKGRRG